MIIREVFGKNNKQISELYNGLEFPVTEYIKFVGGPSTFKKIVKRLEQVIKEEIQDNKKKGYEMGVKIKKIYYPETAEISWALKPYEVYLRYSIFAEDVSGHQFSVGHTIYMKKKTEEIDVLSGWEG